MSSKQLLRLAAVLLAVLVLWGAVALASRRSDGASERDRIVPRVDSTTVDTLALTGPADSAILTRTRAGVGPWQVNGHPADPQVVTELLKALADTGATAELVARNPASHARFRVTEDSGRRVRAVRQGRTLIDLIAGKRTAEWDGLYLRRAGEPEVYVVRGDLATALARPGDEWRNHTIATITPDSVAIIEVRRGSRSYTLRRKGSGWAFASGASADSAAVASMLSDYGNVKAAGFATKAQEDSLRFGRSRRSARLLDRRGVPLLSLVFDSTASGVWVRVADGWTGGQARGQADRRSEGQAYRLDTWTADRLTPADSTLRRR
jgi:hypothetical protein